MSVRLVRLKLFKPHRAAADADPMRATRRTRIRSEIAGAIFRLCSVAGLLLGLLYGMDAPPAEPPRCNTQPCVADSFVAGLKPVLVPTGMGLAVGAGAGLVLALAIKKTGRSLSSRR
jgi:hypothetical protein